MASRPAVRVSSTASRLAKTVLDAVGGGLAGHEVEKRVRSVTPYAARVRMDNGALRTITLAHIVASGCRVTVDGKTLHESTSAMPRAVRVGQNGGTWPSR